MHKTCPFKQENHRIWVLFSLAVCTLFKTSVHGFTFSGSGQEARIPTGCSRSVAPLACSLSQGMDRASPSPSPLEGEKGGDVESGEKDSRRQIKRKWRAGMSDRLSLLEKSVGIRGFLRPSGESGGFRGVFKHRFEDFHVHEISKDGQILHLQSVLSREEVALEIEEKRNTESGAAFCRPDFSFSSDLRQTLCGGGGPFLESDVEALESFIRTLGCAAPSRKKASSQETKETGGGGGSVSFSGEQSGETEAVEPSPIILIGRYDACMGMQDEKEKNAARKDVRKRMHEAVREHLFFLNSDTKDFDLSLFEEAQGGGEGEEERQWPEWAPACWQREAGGDEDRRRQLQAAGGKVMRVFAKRTCLDALGFPKPKDEAPPEGEGAQGEDEGFGGRGGRGRGRGRGAQRGRGGRGGRVRTAYQKARDQDRERWPGDRPNYLHFLVWKSDWSTHDAVNTLSTCCGRGSRCFTFAGSKDKRAVTVQALCCHRLSEERLRHARMDRRWPRGLHAESMGYSNEVLRLGDLQGNHFRIALRGLSLPAWEGGKGGGGERQRGALENVVDDAMSSLRERGFLNFFGLQRFGTSDEIRTFDIGAALLRQDWENAFDLIIGDAAKLRGRGEGETKQARQGDIEESQVRADPRSGLEIWRSTRDAAAALERLPRQYHIERTLLSARASGLDWLGCLKKLPFQTLSLYLHAAQSLLFNEALAERVQRGGARVLKGDLVASSGVDEFSGANVGGDDVEGDGEGEGEGGVEQGEVAEQDDEMEEEEQGGKKMPVPNDNFSPRLVETDEEASTLSFFDVLLPLPGDAAVFPSCLGGQIREVYANTSRNRLGVELEQVKSLRQDMPSLSGEYRRIAVKPKDMRWQIVHQAPNATIPLLASDVDNICARQERDEKTDATTGAGGASGSLSLETVAGAGGESSPSDPLLTPFLAQHATEVRSQRIESEPLSGPPGGLPHVTLSAEAVLDVSMGVQGDQRDESSLDAEENDSQLGSGSSALLFSCSLPKSAYLTMALREVLSTIES
uniref:TRUD domain-containing protein n=1 Tax=Chromera velia CCMP2878 TaxID=1169474 RepID=A0A0G4HRN9_9ALVE|eukprot:Cvel_8130.t1-p1 / transcript=Cvel_8130.t1 / gene=Cvel_8130 / organism=Chromera_velia_CCMP2878 / gene_product=Putative pseudouridine synthase C1A4.09, putative / transcript_product=Putative pseudouridine synthase C1A4.09, putative / location=Cvel_scaffold442:38260-42781(-) / protein_length=1023 / sequence_SO=supercontig / SO=protein_coding / is_pseudo=false